MARFVTGNSFSTGNQVTAATLNAAVNNATISADSVDNSSVAVSGSGVLSVKTSTGESDGITFGKMQHIPANTVLVRDANDVGVVSAKAVTDTQILIGDGTGFTAAALSGDVTMTNAGAVTIANDAVETAMIADDVALGGNPTTTTQSASNNSTRIATTAYVDAQVTAGVALGTPNNRARIKCFPTDFKESNHITAGGTLLDTDNSSTGIHLAMYDIPAGYKATTFVGRGGNADITIYERLDVSAATGSTLKGSGALDGLATIDFTDITATDTNAIVLHITDGGSNGYFYGGYITLVAV